MISRLLRPATLIGTAAFGLLLAPSLNAVNYYNWTGAADSNYLNAANWTVNALWNDNVSIAVPAAVAPSGISDIRFQSTATNRTLNLNYTGTGEQIVQVYGMQSGLSLGYTMNLSGTSAGWLNYDIVGRGTHPFGVDATTTNTGSSANRLAFYLNMGSYSKITFTGSTSLAMAPTSGLTYAKITMAANTLIDASTMTSGSGSTVGIGGLNMAQGSTVYLGNYVAYLNGLNAKGETQIWAGHIYSNPTVVATAVNYGVGTTQLTPTGVVDLPGGFLLRSGGTYLVDGVHNGPISTYAGQASVLGGTGTINGAVSINASGLLAPAGAGLTGATMALPTIGTLTINGNVALNGTLSLEMLSPAHFDKLVINGNLVLGGPTNTSSLSAAFANDFPLVPATYRVVQLRNGTISNSFSTVNLGDKSWSYFVGADYIDITYTQLLFAAKYPQFIGNDKILADFMDKATLSGAAPAVLVDSMNRKDSTFFQSVINQLSPATYYSWYPAAVEHTNSLVQTLDDRVDQRGERLVHSVETYSFNYRQESSINRSDTIHTDYSNFDTVSYMVGTDYKVSPLLVVGGLIDSSSTHTDLDTFKSVSTTDSYTGALYAQHRRENFQLQLVGFMGADKYVARRNVANTTLGDWATSNTNGTRLGASLSGAYTYRTKWVEIDPMAGVQVLDWRAKGFNEADGGLASLAVANQFEVSLAGHVGVRLAQSYKTANGFIRPFVSFNVQHEFNGGDRTMKGNLWGDKLSVNAPGIQSQGIHVNAGVDFDVTHALSMQLRYSIGHGGASSESLGVRGGLTYAF